MYITNTFQKELYESTWYEREWVIILHKIYGSKYLPLFEYQLKWPFLFSYAEMLRRFK